MSHKLNCIMLIDDDEDDNFFHEKAIIDNHLAETVIVENMARKALEYLMMKSQPVPDLIFLDINMPVMTGWEFLDEYNQLQKEMQNRPVIIMLSTSINNKDMEKAKTWDFVSDYVTKPLTKEMMEDIIDKYFKNFMV